MLCYGPAGDSAPRLRLKAVGHRKKPQEEMTFSASRS